MKRIVFVWLPDWPIERLRRQMLVKKRAQPPSPSPARPSVSHALDPGTRTAPPHDPGSRSPDRRILEADSTPLALVATGRHGLTVTTVDAAAAAGGIRPGMALADARALLPELRSRPAGPLADARALVRLARWCGRYGPARNIDIRPMAGADDERLLADHGLWIDVTGVAHLFGGETALLDDLASRLARFGLTARIGLADTLGAAHALARFAGAAAQGRRPYVVAPAGRTADLIAPLPVEALRIDRSAIVTLQRLGLRRIGDLYPLPRMALERRFREAVAEDGVLARLDQALGCVPEPRRPLREIPELALTQPFPTPLAVAEALEAEARRLLTRLCAVLETRGLGLTRVRLVLYRADGTVAEVAAGTSAPVRDAGRIMALLADRLAHLDAGLGVDLLAIEVPAAERLVAAEVPLAANLGGTPHADPTELVDRLSNRLGTSRVALLSPHASHIPERSEIRHAALQGGGRAWASAAAPVTAQHPAILLGHPEPITVTAEVPDGAPAAFTWRRVTRRVARAEGPERIAPEWWRALRAPSPPEDAAPAPLPADTPRTRDYYRLEDTGGRTYWVFRDGLYGDEAAPLADRPPAWFLHGLFA